MPLHRTLYLLPITVFALILTTLAHADFQEGVDAYKRGDYETALNEWLPLAAQGDADAQIAMGILYVHGQGVPQDYAEARFNSVPLVVANWQRLWWRLLWWRRLWRRQWWRLTPR